MSKKIFSKKTRIIMPKVSVVVPIYNVEKYIERCVRSLFEQTISDIEYIFVDDCTPDNSISILNNVLKDYPNRENQVKIVHHPQNKGLPMARQTGIEKSTGDYIIQCDSDDWVDVNMYEDMYNEAIKSQADVVICGYKVTNGVKSVPYVKCRSTDVNSFIKNCLLQKESASLWSKLFKRELFRNNIVYPKCGMGEDIALCIQLIYYSKKLSFIPKAYYYYYSNQYSISKNQSEECVVSRFEQIYDNVTLLECFFKRVKIKKEIRIAFDCFKHIQRNLLTPLLTQKKYYKLWRNAFCGINNKVLFIPLGFREKMYFLLRLIGILKH